MIGHLTDVSIRSLVLAAIAAAVVWFPRRNRPAAMEHAVWAAVVGGTLVLFVFGSALPRLPVKVLRSEPVQISGPVETRPLIVDDAPTAVTPAPAPPRRFVDWREIAAYAYGLIAVGFLTRFLVGMFLVRRLVAKSAAVGGFREWEAIAVPMTVGWFRPEILLPMEWRAWDRLKLEAVLAHEGAHVRRRDGLIAALAAINRCAFWFHPLAWWLERRLGLLAELACDEACLAEMGDRQRYASLLVEMASVVDGTRGRLREHALTMAATSHLRRRIDSILQEGRTLSSGLSRTGWAAIALIGVPMVWGAGSVKLDRQAPMLPLDFPKWTVPAPPAVFAQTRTTPTAPPPAPRVEFEVASVRSANPETGRCTVARFKMDAGHVDIRCVSLQQLMEYAFRLPQTQVLGPDWLGYHGGPKFDVTANLPAGASEDRVPEMLQVLLAQRFGLVMHREYRESSIDALVIAKSGLKLEESPPEASESTAAANASTGRIETVNGAATHPNVGANGAGTLQINSQIGTYRETTLGSGHFRWELSSTTLEGFADLMAERLKRPVMDMTGLKGRYQVALEVIAPPLDLAGLDAAPDLAAASAVIYEQLTGLRDSFNAALQKVGLQLEMRKAQVETIVVDHVEKTPTAN